MIKTEKSITEIQGELWQVEAEFSGTVKAMKKCLCNQTGMTEEKAEARVMELVERGLKSEEELKKEVEEGIKKVIDRLWDAIRHSNKEEPDEKVQ